MPGAGTDRAAHPTHGMAVLKGLTHTHLIKPYARGIPHVRPCARPPQAKVPPARLAEQSLAHIAQ